MRKEFKERLLIFLVVCGVIGFGIYSAIDREIQLKKEIEAQIELQKSLDDLSHALDSLEIATQTAIDSARSLHRRLMDLWAIAEIKETPASLPGIQPSN